MGSLAKRLGQLSRMSFETESANILKTTRANKLEGSLSLALDGTLKQGHDMTAFGLGTLASMASTERYSRFTTAMYHIYSAMEQEMDQCSNDTSATKMVWKKHGNVLRRQPSLLQDLQDVVPQENLQQHLASLPSNAVTNYVEDIRVAGECDRLDDGGRLLGHLYCRYFADLFGGQMLGGPYHWALALPHAPRHYRFEFDHLEQPGEKPPTPPNRSVYIETLYHDINEAGNRLTQKQLAQVTQEAAKAFQHNIQVYTEEAIYMDSIKGAINVGTGATRQILALNRQ